jgi:hypothetical protein
MDGSIALCVASMKCVRVSADFMFDFERVPVEVVESTSAVLSLESQSWVTWRCVGGLFVVFAQWRGRTCCYFPDINEYYFPSPPYVLPAGVKDGVAVIGQFICDVNGDERVHRVLLFDCSCGSSVEDRYTILRSLFRDHCTNGVFVVQWVGYWDSLQALLRDPVTFGVYHGIRGVVSLDTSRAMVIRTFECEGDP